MGDGKSKWVSPSNIRDTVARCCKEEPVMEHAACLGSCKQRYNTWYGTAYVRRLRLSSIRPAAGTKCVNLSEGTKGSIHGVLGGANVEYLGTYGVDKTSEIWCYLRSLFEMVVVRMRLRFPVWRRVGVRSGIYS